MDVVLSIFEFINTFIDAINIIISAIQYGFNLIITVFTAFHSIWTFIQNSISLLYQFSTVVPLWLWVIALSWISFRLVLFVKNIGGD